MFSSKIRQKSSLLAYAAALVICFTCRVVTSIFLSVDDGILEHIGSPANPRNATRLPKPSIRKILKSLTQERSFELCVTGCQITIDTCRDLRTGMDIALKGETLKRN